MDLISTIPGSLMEGFLPAGWDLKQDRPRWRRPIRPT